MTYKLEGIKCPCHPHSISFNPKENQFAVALVTGQIELFTWDNTKKAFGKKESFNHHSDSCRRVRYFPDGKLILSCGADCKCLIYDISGKLLWRKTSHKYAVNALTIIENTKFCSGDDNGTLKIWDFRCSTYSPACSFKETDGYITDITNTKDGYYILATSGNFLQAFDIRMPKGTLLGVSRPEEDDYLSISLMKGESNIICGSECGALCIYNWEDLAKPKDKILTASASVDTLLQLDQNILYAGCSDGQIRMISIDQRKILGTLGCHTKYNTPIQEIASNSNHQIIASIGSDEMIQFHKIDSKVLEMNYNHKKGLKGNQFFDEL